MLYNQYTIDMLMPRISVSIPTEQLQWLKENPQISPSGLFQGALQDEIADDYRDRLKKEIEHRIKDLKLEKRVKVVIDDLKFPIKVPYPYDRIRDLVKFIKDTYDKELEKIKKNELGKVEFVLKDKPANSFASVEFLDDDYPDPIIEFVSWLS